jgi:hypothetical protein
MAHWLTWDEAVASIPNDDGFRPLLAYTQSAEGVTFQVVTPEHQAPMLDDAGQPLFATDDEGQPLLVDGEPVPLLYTVPAETDDEATGVEYWAYIREHEGASRAAE